MHIATFALIIFWPGTLMIAYWLGALQGHTKAGRGIIQRAIAEVQ